MTTTDVSYLSNLFSVLNTDNIHVFRAEEYGSILSYRAYTKNLQNVFQDSSILDTIKNEIDTMMNELKTLSSSMLTKTEAKATYVLSDKLNSEKESLLTFSEMNSTISKYVDEDALNNKAAQLRAEANKLADEMTDFVGAAMVGINQSNSQYQSSEEEED